MPNRAKGRRYPIEISGVAWLDLLGYGSMLRPIKFDPSHADAQQAVKRLEAFQRIAAKAAMRHMPALIVNDGIAYVRELSPRTRAVSYDFLHRVFNSFRAVNDIDQKAGFPGARMIVATGPRLRISGVVRPDTVHLASILERFSEGAITANQAIREAFRSAPLTGSVSQLQANFAFTKAYLADEAGGAYGFKGNHCFVDAALFADPPPKWLSISKSFDWTTDGMSARFLQVAAIDNHGAGAVNHKGMHNALDVARTLGITY
jgi:hypothetical protein